LGHIKVRDFGEELRDEEWIKEANDMMSDQEKVDYEKIFKADHADKQFERYMQVLDTDYDNYLVMYQCLESAQYFDVKTGFRVSAHTAHANVTKKPDNAWGQVR